MVVRSSNAYAVPLGSGQFYTLSDHLTCMCVTQRPLESGSTSPDFHSAQWRFPEQNRLKSSCLRAVLI